MHEQNVRLGLGLIGIGREWGHLHPEVPDEAATIRLLEAAVELGVTYLDTAPSYGWSELRLGRFLGALPAATRKSLTIATKFGEHWDFDRAEPFVDHSRDALRRSLDRSIELLGRIDVLQLHKTTPEVLRSADLSDAWEYARSLGIPVLGASVAELESGAIAAGDAGLNMLQMPYNPGAPHFGQLIESANAAGKWVATNRPFGMGKLLYTDEPLGKQEAFEYVLKRLKSGVVLSGTKSAVHLRENVQAFRAAVAVR